MLVESRRGCEERNATPCRGSPHLARAAVWVVLVGLVWSGLSASGFSQDAPPARPGTATDSAAPPADRPIPEWPPYKPGLVIESDCFADAEVALVFPHLSSRLTAPVQLGPNGPTALVSLPNAHLDATASTLLQVGEFRFGPGYGELALSYRLMAADGTDGGSASRIRSRLNFQTFSLDYLRNDCPLPNHLLLSWEVGARLQVVFFDSQAQTEGAFEQARNYFFGAGPHAGVGLTRMLSHDFGLYSHFDAALIVGYNTDQDFVLATNDPENGVLSGSASQQQTQLSPSFMVQTGLTWTPDWMHAARLRSGYQFEQYYELGHVARSRGNLSAHGLFLSAELSY